jgi:transcriptional regulator with XRE-family HTH domain
LMPKSQFTDAYGAFLQALIAARKAAGVSQAELGRRLGRDQPFVSLIERGVRRVDVIEFYAIATALGVDSIALYTDVVRAMPAKIEI